MAITSQSGATDAPVVCFEAVSKRFGRHPPVLRDVTIALPGGVCTQVRGRNGAGKSTFLRLAAGVSTPTSGRVRVLADRVAYVPEGGVLGPG